MGQEGAAWSLSEQERNETIERVVASISSLAFFHSKTVVSAEDARRAAVAIERKAYTTAQVAARTTTGNRPISETTSSYARCGARQRARIRGPRRSRSAPSGATLIGLASSAQCLSGP